MWKEAYKALFQKHPRREPKDPIPSSKTDLKQLVKYKNVMIWFGHSSIFLQLDGKTFLIDPVLSGSASPLPWGTKAYKGTDIYSVDDLPAIDYVLISHDHYDHLDYQTMLALKHKVKHVICGLGVGAHLEHWGYPSDMLVERDWYERIDFEDGITIFTETTHHQSGRSFAPARNLWLSFLIQTPSMKVFYTGDGGYGPHFAEIGQRHGPIDWALMENGQYNLAWHAIHCLPEEVAQAAVELNVKNMMPVHHSKFTLSHHAWDEPLHRISEASLDKSYRLVTPLIGQAVELNNMDQSFSQWWTNVR
jgi:L-ascorbate metabolism protein UlaG (beta-lactamase superfamily)